MSKEDKHVRVHVAGSFFEAQQAQQLLNDAGIPNILVSYSDTALNGLFQATKGFGEIQVQQERKTEAQQVLSEGLPDLRDVDQEDLEREATQATPAPETSQPGSSAWLFKLLAAVAALVAIYLIWQFLLD